MILKIHPKFIWKQDIYIWFGFQAPEVKDNILAPPQHQLKKKQMHYELVNKQANSGNNDTTCITYKKEPYYKIYYKL